MDMSMRNLWIQALGGSAKAYRKLGICFFRGKWGVKDRKLAKACLEKAAELGDEPAYFLYHKLFSKNKKVVDDASYADMRETYRNTGDSMEKKRLKRYLSLGTKKQKSSRNNK